METTIKKTTKIVKAITWEGTITDDDGRSIARMTGALNATSPLGNTNLIVINTSKYAENSDDIKSAYTDFVTAVKTEVDSIGDLNSSTTETVE